MTQYEERIKKDITEIRESLRDLAQRVEKALEDSRRVFLNQDSELAYATVLGDHRLNRDSTRIDRLCHTFIARHAPSAGHLRLMSSVIRVSIALERIGDYAVTICREAVQMANPPQGTLARDMASVGDESQHLLHESMAAFMDGNSASARALMPLCSHVQGVMPGIYDELVEGQGSSRYEMMAEFVVLSLLKRVADQAKNICDQTVFAIDGENKPVKTLNVLVVDQDNVADSKLVDLLGNHRFGTRCNFVSAGVKPGPRMEQELVDFLEQQGIDVTDVTGQNIDQLPKDLEAFPILISMDGPISQYVERIPFHTSVLNWDLAEGAQGDASVQHRFEVANQKLSDLMITVFGSDAE